MSGDVMSFPDNWWTFVQQYQFADKEEIYTNGSMLIPSFRVRQMVEHYFGGKVGKTSRYSELFGTPERAARTLELLHVEWSDWCAVFSECRDCMFGQVDGELVTCWEPDDFSLLEWLRGDA